MSQPTIPSGSPDVTLLLELWNSGDPHCLEQLLPIVEGELRRIAHRHMHSEREGHTLQTTALMNEAYLKLIDQSRANWQHRTQFYGVAASLMRRILVDHARGRQRLKRGGAGVNLPLNEEMAGSLGKSSSLIALDDALEDLSQQHPRQAKVVELRHFGGLSVEETAVTLEIHPNTVIRDWGFAKAWLKRELNKTDRKAPKIRED